MSLAQILSLSLALLSGVTVHAYDKEAEENVFSSFSAYVSYEQNGRWDAKCAWQQQRSVLDSLSQARLSTSREDKMRALNLTAQFLKTCSTPHSATLMHGLKLGLILFPTLPHNDAVALTIESFKQNGLTIEDKDLAWTQPLPQPEDLCPTKSLMNDRAFAGPFRLTNQARNNCYAHASVKAVDYFQSGHGLPLTSIAATSVELNEPREESSMEGIDFGFPGKVVQYLNAWGGCKLDELDQINGGNLEWIETFIRDLEGSKADLIRLNSSHSQNTKLSNMNRADLEKELKYYNQMAAITSKWAPTTIAVWIRSLQKDRTVLVQSLKNNRPILRAQTEDYLMKSQYLMDAFLAQSRTSPRFMAFANFVLETSFCSESRTQYAPMKARNLWQSYSDRTEGIRYIKEHFKQSNPQPLITDICYEVLKQDGYPRPCSPHSVLIVGQRYNWNTATCEYQVLNSWGSVDHYPTLPAENKDLAHGVVWLPKKNLGQGLLSLSVIEAGAK